MMSEAMEMNEELDDLQMMAAAPMQSLAVSQAPLQQM